jgi:branched-subunit amino acid aminotransferase/4-amino-4-deoxychorismate lyase
LEEFDECFLTSTTRDIVPVCRIEDVRFKVNKRTLTARLKKMFSEYVQKRNDREKVMKIF